jgi:hypothetical protein
VVVIKIEVVAIKTGVEDMEGVIIVEVVTRIEEVAIRIEEAVIRTKGVAIRIEEVVEEGAVVVEAEGGAITIDRWSNFPGISVKICDIMLNS